MISDGHKSHFCLIKNMGRLLADQHSSKMKYHYRMYCLHGFTSHSVLENHQPYCKNHGEQKIDLPKEQDKWLYYKNVRK